MITVEFIVLTKTENRVKIGFSNEMSFRMKAFLMKIQEEKPESMRELAWLTDRNIYKIKGCNGTKNSSLTARLMDKCLNIPITQFSPGTLQVF